MRLTLTIEEIEELLRLNNGSKVFDKIESQLNEEIYKDKTTKQNATKKANTSKINKSKRLVQDAINILNLEGKKINSNSVAKQANISRVTATKYLKYIYD